MRGYSINKANFEEGVASSKYYQQLHLFKETCSNGSFQVPEDGQLHLLY